MKRFGLAIVALLALFALAGCGTGPKKRVFPPEVRVQELLRQTDGSWQVQWRVSNFSNVPMRLERLELRLTLHEWPEQSLDVSSDVLIAANSVEVLNSTLPLDATQRGVLDALSTSQSVRYDLRGRAFFSDPDRKFDLTYNSALSPAPGLPGVLR